MVQVRLCLGQRHPMRGDSGYDLAARTSYTLRIRELGSKSATQCGQDSLLLFRCICVFAQTSLTLREFNALNRPDSIEKFCRASSGRLSIRPADHTLPGLPETVPKFHLCLLFRDSQPL